MITTQDISTQLDEWAPPRFAESYDNIGLLTGNFESEIRGVLVSLDMIEDVVDEAIDLQYNMIIAHHPIWFKGRKRLIGEDYVSKTIMKAIKNDISLYAVHTNLDNQKHGVNLKIANKLGLLNPTLLQPIHTAPNVGAGMIGILEKPYSVNEFLSLLKHTFSAKCIKYSPGPQTFIQKVAVCGGAGSFLTIEALKQGADAYVTSDITYHKFFDNQGKMLLADIGHYESEQYTSELICDFLKEKFPNFAIQMSKVNTNPVKYFY